MNSIGLDISKSTLSVYIPINKEELTIDNTPKGIRELYAKLKKVYKKSDSLPSPDSSITIFIGIYRHNK